MKASQVRPPSVRTLCSQGKLVFWKIFCNSIILVHQVHRRVGEQSRLQSNLLLPVSYRQSLARHPPRDGRKFDYSVRRLVRRLEQGHAVTWSRRSLGVVRTSSHANPQLAGANDI